MGVGSVRLVSPASPEFLRVSESSPRLKVQALLLRQDSSFFYLSPASLEHAEVTEIIFLCLIF